MIASSTPASAVADTDANGSDAHQSVSKALTRSRDRLLVDLETLIDDAQALLKEAAESSTEYVADVPAYLENRFDMLKNNYHRARAVIEQEAKLATVAADRYVKENPWKWTAYVAAASLLVSILLVNAWGPAFGTTGSAEK